MSLIPTFAIPDNLPAPVTSGTTVQSFTDVWGDVWIAKNGVYGGAWKRPRDTLIGKWYRNTAYTSAGNVALPFDATVRDAYGMYTSASSACTVPIAGVYDVTYQYSVTATATAQWAAQRLYISTLSGNLWLSGIMESHSSLAAIFSTLIHQQYPLNAGDTIQFLGGAGTSLACVATATGTYACVEYYGTG